MKKPDYKKVLSHFKKHDPKIHKYMIKVDFNQWIKPQFKHYEENDLFQTLCREIIGQQLSGKAAQTIYDRFVGLFDNRPLNPLLIAETQDENLRSAGLSGAKTKYIKDLAQKVMDKEIDLQSLSGLPDEDVIKELTRVKGIGNWTAEMFLLFKLNRENIFSHGDLGLKKGITKVYGIENPSAVEINSIVEKWDPYKSFGTITLWQSLEI